MKTKPLFKTTLFTLLFMLIGGQLAWANGSLPKKDSLELVKAIKDFKKKENKAIAELDNKLKKETDSLKAEDIAQKGNYEIDKQIVDFITEHPNLMDLSDSQLIKLLEYDVHSSSDGRIRYYTWVYEQYDDHDYMSRVMQYRTDDGQVKVCWDEPFFDDTYAPWGYAFTPTEIYPLDHHGKQVYIVEEYVQNAVYTWEQFKAITIENGKVLDVPIFDCKEICYKNYYFSIYADYFNPDDEFVLPTQIASAIGVCINDSAKTHGDDYISYDPTMREITLMCNDEPREKKVIKYDDKKNLFVLRTFPPTTDPTEIAVGQRVKAIMEDALDRYNQIEDPNFNNLSEEEKNKRWEYISQLDDDYCSQNWNALVDSINVIDESHPDSRFFEADYWVKGQDFSDGPHLKLLSIDDIQKIDNNTYVVVYTFLKYIYSNAYSNASVKMVRERGNWYIDDFIDGIGTSDWKDQMRRYIKDPW